MIKVFFVMSLFGAMMCYWNLDPMKSCFFLILSMLMLMPLMSFGNNIWYSYFISLLFLSGIFVILVYFSSLSSLSMSKVYYVLVGVIFVVLSFVYEMKVVQKMLVLNVFYFQLYSVVLMFILFMLLIFMNFTSYFLNFSGALRKV
uniref:NADH dehydrogenase subunit 6 n=1 Tax=Trichostrongylus vitrinus TaxID=40352 RepID=D3J7Z6_TRIVI|nr:NADH dehydrogenase subunit 6 [Trichostrongylus vitrinus]ACX85097.1 NADH dehydrogenase subunit 6 [Trichostrongylus vitrinus]